MTEDEMHQSEQALREAILECRQITLEKLNKAMQAMCVMYGIKPSIAAVELNFYREVVPLLAEQERIFFKGVKPFKHVLTVDWIELDVFLINYDAAGDSNGSNTRQGKRRKKRGKD